MYPTFKDMILAHPLPFFLFWLPAVLYLGIPINRDWYSLEPGVQLTAAVISACGSLHRDSPAESLVASLPETKADRPGGETQEAAHPLKTLPDPAGLRRPGSGAPLAFRANLCRLSRPFRLCPFVGPPFSLCWYAQDYFPAVFPFPLQSNSKTFYRQMVLTHSQRIATGGGDCRNTARLLPPVTGNWKPETKGGRVSQFTNRKEKPSWASLTGLPKDSLVQSMTSVMKWNERPMAGKQPTIFSCHSSRNQPWNPPAGRRRRRISSRATMTSTPHSPAGTGHGEIETIPC